MITIYHWNNEGVITVRENGNLAGIKLDCYTRGWDKPNYPMPAIDYYSSTKREHIPIGNVMEWYFDVDQIIYHRGDKP